MFAYWKLLGCRMVFKPDWSACSWNRYNPAAQRYVVFFSMNPSDTFLIGIEGLYWVVGKGQWTFGTCPYCEQESNSLCVVSSIAHMIRIQKGFASLRTNWKPRQCVVLCIASLQQLRSCHVDTAGAVWQCRFWFWHQGLVLSPGRKSKEQESALSLEVWKPQLVPRTNWRSPAMSQSNNGARAPSILGESSIEASNVSNTLRFNLNKHAWEIVYSILCIYIHSFIALQLMIRICSKPCSK